MKRKPKKANSSPSLWKTCETEYFPRRVRIRSTDTTRQYRYSINDFGNFLGREATIADLNDDTVHEWVKHLQRQDLSSYTVRDKLGRVLTLWNWLAKRRVIEQFPTVEQIEVHELVPTALTEKQLRALFDEVQREHGSIEGVRARDWWSAFLGFVWATGERKGAALLLRWEHVCFDSKQIVIPANFRKGRRKTGIYPIWDDLARLLKRIEKPARELVFPWPYSEGCFYYRYGKIAVRCGLPDDRKHKTHSLRVSHATWLRVLGGDPTAALMHGDAATTRKHYIDPRLIPAEERKLFVPWNPVASNEHKTADWL